LSAIWEMPASREGKLATAKREVAMSLAIVDNSLVAKSCGRTDAQAVVALGDARRKRSSLRKALTTSLSLAELDRNRLSRIGVESSRVS